MLSGLLLSCDRGEKQPLANPTQINKYFPLKDFVEEQIQELEGAKVNKTAAVNGEKTASSVSLDAEDWRKELDAFIQADINKTALSLSYETAEDNDRLVHSLKPGEKGVVQEIIIDFHPGSPEVSSIHFKTATDNLFYSSSSEGNLEINAEGLMENYQVKGHQKVWFLSPNEIEIEGKIIR